MVLDLKALGNRLKQVRGKLSQKAFGEPIGYGYGYVKNCEHGKKPSLEYLFAVCSHYKVSLDWLLGLDPIVSTQYTNSIKELIGAESLAEYISNPDFNGIVPNELFQKIREHKKIEALDLDLKELLTNPIIKEIISIFRSISPDAQRILLGTIRTIVNSSKDEKTLSSFEEPKEKPDSTKDTA